jgi:hypothetical protein
MVITDHNDPPKVKRAPDHIPLKEPRQGPTEQHMTDAPFRERGSGTASVDTRTLRLRLAVSLKQLLNAHAFFRLLLRTLSVRVASSSPEVVDSIGTKNAFGVTSLRVCLVQQAVEDTRTDSLGQQFISTVYATRRQHAIATERIARGVGLLIADTLMYGGERRANELSSADGHLPLAATPVGLNRHCAVPRHQLFLVAPVSKATRGVRIGNATASSRQFRIGGESTTVEQVVED